MVDKKKKKSVDNSKVYPKKRVDKSAPKLTEDEREELKQEGELPKKKVRNIENKQLIGFFIIVALVFATFLIPYFYAQSQKTFNYLGLDWSVEKYDELKIYHARYPIIYKGDISGFHNTYLRNNPRTNDIEYNAGNISFKNNVILLHSPETISCKNQILVTSLLGQKFGAFPFIEETSGAIDDKAYAEKYNLPYASCEENSTTSTIVHIKRGEQTEIIKEGDCYAITLSDCEDSLLAAERFVIEIIDQLNYEKVEWK